MSIARIPLSLAVLCAALLGLPIEAHAQGFWPFAPQPVAGPTKEVPKAKDQPAAAATKAPPGKTPAKSRPAAAALETVTPITPTQRSRDAFNQWVVGLAAGRIEGAPLRLAAEIAQVTDDGANMRVMPIVTRGVFENMTDILFLRGVDGAIVYSDVMEHFKTKQKISNIENRVAYLANLFVAEMHVLARPGINTLQDLAGKKVNFNTPGTAAAFTGPIVFERLGIDIVKQFEPHREVMAAMSASDDVAAVVFVTTKPVPPIAQPAWPPGFKLIPVDYTSALEELYLPAYLDHAEYPKLIPPGQKVATIAVPVVLAVFNAAPDTDRYRRLARFVDKLFERLPQLQKPPYDPSWKSVNLAATVPGWKRFAAAQQKLDQAEAAKPRVVTTSGAPVAAAVPAPAIQGPAIDIKLARQQAARAAPNDLAEQERMFQKFLEWNRTQAR